MDESDASIDTYRSWGFIVLKVEIVPCCKTEAQPLALLHGSHRLCRVLSHRHLASTVVRTLNVLQ